MSQNNNTNWLSSSREEKSTPADQSKGDDGPIQEAEGSIKIVRGSDGISLPMEKVSIEAAKRFASLPNLLEIVEEEEEEETDKEVNIEHFSVYQIALNKGSPKGRPVRPYRTAIFRYG